MIPAGVSTALLIVVFGSESDVRLAQEAGGEAAARANACADGAIDVPAMATIGAPSATATRVPAAVAPAVARINAIRAAKKAASALSREWVLFMILTPFSSGRK